MNQENKNQFSLRLVQKCPVCNKDYNQGKVEILEESEMSFLAYLTCNACFSNILVRVNTLPHGVIGNAILTDLSSREVLNFTNQSDIESNNVLEIHEIIGKDSEFVERMRNI